MMAIDVQPLSLQKRSIYCSVNLCPPLLKVWRYVFGIQEMEKSNETSVCYYSYACRSLVKKFWTSVRSKGWFVCFKVCTSYQNPQDKVPSRKKATQTASPWAWWKNRTDSLLISLKGCSHLFPWPILSIIVDEILRLTLLHLEKRNKLPTVNPILYLQLDTSDCAENWNTSQAMFLHVLN